MLIGSPLAAKKGRISANEQKESKDGSGPMYEPLPE